MSRDFRYHNENPYKVEESDCVIRAISRALNIEYPVAEELLKMSAEHNGCDMLCVGCYHHLLEDVFKLPVRYADNWERVKDISKQFENNKVLIRIDGHLTMSDCGVIYDLWDCTNRLVDCYWIVNN
jgi:hypothetical protein